MANGGVSYHRIADLGDLFQHKNSRKKRGLWKETDGLNQKKCEGEGTKKSSHKI